MSDSPTPSSTPRRGTLKRLAEVPNRWLASLYLGRCDRVGPGVRVIGRPLVQNDGRIELGRDVTLRSQGSSVRITATIDGSVSIGDGVLIDVGAQIFSDSTVRIEQGAVIGPRSTICDRDEKGRSGDLVIEANVRVGAGVRIIGPCRIGAGATLLAGSVVRADVPAGAIVEPEARFRSLAPPNVGPAPAPIEREPDFRTNGVSTHHAAPVLEPTRVLRAVLAADFTVNELAEHLRVVDHDGVAFEAEIAPFAQVVPTLMSLARAETKPDVLMVWTQPECISPGFAAGLASERMDAETILADVDAFANLVKEHAQGAARFVFVPTWVLAPWYRGSGMLEHRADGPTNLLMRMNLRLADALRSAPNVFVLDAQRWLSAARDGAFDPKLWYAGKVLFTSDVLTEAARDVRAALRGLLGMSRKLVVVDLDDTMWGGIVGDVGWENLRLGGHDPNGEAFVQFQRQLLGLTKRGIALAVVSKNEESTALDAMRNHPEMLIRPEMLAAYRINWRDKAQNILELAAELNLGLQSVVFLDDNPVERGRVHEALPEVFVPDWPADPTHYPRALETLACFDAPRITAEDAERNAMYATERERTSLRNQVSSHDDWLATLGITVRFEPLGPANVGRATQLLNKTNQMNLRTRRLSETELLAWVHDAGEGPRETWTVSVSDRFGAAGLTGLLSVARQAEDVHLVDYVLSCRVMGRRVEETLLWASAKRAAALGGKRLVVAPIPTAKNKPCLDFVERSGLSATERGYVKELDGDEPAPERLTIEGLS
jgi:FkbH-like protein